MAYSEKVVEHYENPRNVGSFDKGDDAVGTGMVGAPACGDVMKLQIRVGDDGRIVGRVTEAARASADALRAIDAVHEAEPYADAYRGKTFTVNFNARAACAGR